MLGHLDDFPDIESGPDHRRTATHWSIDEVDAGMLVHPHTLLEVPLGQCRVFLPEQPRTPAEALQRARRGPHRKLSALGHLQAM